MTPAQIDSLRPELAEFLRSFDDCFVREPTRRYLGIYVAGLLSDIQRKSVEPIALAAGVPPRSMQEFLSQFEWDDHRLRHMLQLRVADRYASPHALAILDASGHAKSGDKTPGVQRQHCGELGKVDNCVVGQHLLYAINDKKNPFSCVLASDLFLPQSWDQDPGRRREAGIPDDLHHRPKWKIGIDQLERAIGNGVRFQYVLADEDYGRIPAFWFELDRLGLVGVCEVPSNFHAWATLPHWTSGRAEHASKHVENLVRLSPVFLKEDWHSVECREQTRGRSLWWFKAARVHLVAESSSGSHGPAVPTVRLYWLIGVERPGGKERRYFVSNAPAGAKPAELIKAAMERWHVEKWFERAKQEAGLGDFEVRTYRGLLRHWLCSGLAMYFLSSQTRRLRGEKSVDHAGADQAGRDAARLQTAGSAASHGPGAGECLCVLPGA